MAETAPRDPNRITGIVLSANDATGLFNWWIDPITHRALVSGVITGLPKSSTGGGTSVASANTSSTLLAANSARLGATIFNDSTQVLYLKLGSTASSTSHTLQMAAASYYEVPFGYTGIIDGIWAAANGFARITELT